MWWQQLNNLSPLWRANKFGREELSAYSRHMMVNETQRGVLVMSLLAMVMLLAEALLFTQLGFGKPYLYTCLLLALLAAHIALSTRAVVDINSLYLLAMTILIISGVAFVLLAQQTGTFSAVLFASVALLFMVIPMVPWGLREACIVTGLIYGTFTASTWSVSLKFEREALWTLQFIMAAAGVISITLVARNVSVRKSDIMIRYEMEMARNKILLLSNKDPLTGAWNRRYLQQQFEPLVEGWHEQSRVAYFAFIDIDDFKPLNDNLGHDYGDQILRWLTRELSEQVGEHGIVVRMGGDEFALLTDCDKPQQLLANTVQWLREQVRLDQRCKPSMIGLSAGVAVMPPGSPALQHRVCKIADNALYAAKLGKDMAGSGLHYRQAAIEMSQGQH